MDLVLGFFIKDQYIFKLLFIFYFLMFAFKLGLLLVKKKRLANYFIFHLLFFLLSGIGLFMDEFIGAAIVVLFAYFSLVSSKEWLFKVPLLGPIAGACRELNQFYADRWEFVAAYHKESPVSRFFGIYRNQEVREWRKAEKKVFDRHVDSIFRGSVKANLIIGGIQYLIDPRIAWGLGLINKEREISLPLFIVGILFQALQALIMGVSAGFFLIFIKHLVELYNEIKYEDPLYAKLL